MVLRAALGDLGMRPQWAIHKGPVYTYVMLVAPIASLCTWGGLVWAVMNLKWWLTALTILGSGVAHPILRALLPYPPITAPPMAIGCCLSLWIL